jgi:class 3 adenylate cyclase
MKTTVSSHGGHVIKMIGDTCCAAFPSATEALQAALAAQRATFAELWDKEAYPCSPSNHTSIEPILEQFCAVE